MKGMQRIISGWLAFCLVLSMLPMQVFAVEETVTETVMEKVVMETVAATVVTVPPETIQEVTVETIPEETVEEIVTEPAVLASETVITTEEQMQLIAQNPSGSYTLGGSLSLSAETVKILQNCYFTGNLDGAGHSLSFSISETANNRCGLFDGINGVVQRLTLQGDISLDSCTVKEVGLLASNFGENSYIYDCTVKGSITVTNPASDSYPIIGGIIGNGNGLVEKCKSLVTISVITGTSAEIGGTVGAMYAGQLLNSHYSGSISLVQNGSDSNYYSVNGLTGSGYSSTAVGCTVGGSITVDVANASGRVTGLCNADDSFNNAAISLTVGGGSISCVGASGGSNTHNTGSISLTTTGNCTSYAHGLEAVTDGINTGTVTAEGQLGSVTASGISQCTDSTNEAEIRAINAGGDAYANGAMMAATGSINKASVSAVATNGVAMAKGINGNGSAEECYNYGAVYATATTGQARSYGIEGCSNSENTGDVTTRSYGETSLNCSASGAGGTCVTNRGAIYCEGDQATGVMFAYGVEGSYSRNYGTVKAVGGNGHATARGVQGSYCENYGEVSASSSGPGDVDRGSATAYGTSEKGTNSYNAAMVSAVSKYSAARAYGAGESTSVSDGTAYANSECYDIVTEDGNTVYRMGYVYAGSSLNATANLAGTTVTSSSGEGSKYIYFFMPSSACDIHSSASLPGLTTESMDCGCYNATGQAASSVKKDYVSQIPDPKEGEDEEEEEDEQIGIIEYLDNSTITINYAGSAYAYYLSEPNNTFHYNVDGKAGVTQSDEDGILRVPLGTFDKQGTHTVQVVFTYAQGEQLDPEITFSATVKVSSLEFTQAWTASMDARVAGNLSLGASAKYGPMKMQATFSQAEAGASLGASLNISREHAENGETLTLSSDKKIGLDASITSGVSGNIIRQKYTLAEVSAGSNGAVTGSYGIKIENYGTENNTQNLAIATYLLGEALTVNPYNIYYRPLYTFLVKTAFSDSGCAVIEGGSAEVVSSAGASLLTERVNGEKIFAGLDGTISFATSYSEQQTSTGEQEKAISWKSSANVSALSKTSQNDVSVSGSLLSKDYLGSDITIAAKTGKDEKTLETTSLSSSKTGLVWLVLGERTNAEYNQFIFKDEVLRDLTYIYSGINDYVNNDRKLLVVPDMLKIGDYLSVSDEAIDYKRQVKDYTLYSIPIGIGASVGLGADLGITLSYMEDTNYTNAAGYAKEDQILLNAESEGLSEEIDEKTFRLEELFTDALPALTKAAWDFFQKAVGAIKDGVRLTWGWIEAKMDSTSDWEVSLTAAPSEKDGPWAESSSVSVKKSANSGIALAYELVEEAENTELLMAATVGRPFAVGVTNTSTEEIITDLSKEPLKFTIRYAEEDLEAAGVDESNLASVQSSLAMYRYSDEGDYFEYVGGVCDVTAMTVTATITKPGQYVLAVDTCAPRLTKLDVSNYGATPTITATVDDIAGMDLNGFLFSIDGDLKVDSSNVTSHYNKETGEFTYTVPAEQTLTEGTHTISFTLADATGNSDTYEYELTVDLTAPVLSETTVTGSANSGTVLEIRTQVSDEHLSGVYAMFSKQLSDGTWSEEVRCDLGNLGDGLWGLDYEGEGSTIRVRIIAEDLAENTTTSEVYTISGKTIKTPNEAVAEMTWGANLVDLYIADVDRSEGSTTGYIDFAPSAELGLALWFWNYDFHWLSYHEAQRGTFTVSAPFPTFESASAWTGDLFRIGVMTESTDREISITLSDSKIVKSNGEVIALPSMDRNYTGLTSEGPDINGWCTYSIYPSAEAPEENAELDGATFYTTVTIEEECYNLTSKADYYFQYQRYEMDQKELTDVFLHAGANVFRLPVTWTSFVNDTTFEIDQEWLEAVKREVDYIISHGAYCILNMHNDYLQRSFVGTKQNGTWTDLHWERDWMEEQYAEYVDARFAAVWKQIAEYFKDYPELLIFETCNEPTMDWYSSVDYNPWINSQIDRVNEMNELFVETVRSTGGENATRILCLAVAEYNQHHRLSKLELPEDDYLMVQVHSYQEMESDPNSGSNDPNFDYMTATDEMFADVATFQEAHPEIPVIVGEVGITHREDDAVQAPKVDYFYRTAEAHGVPCLWWEDCFVVDNNTQYWIYDKRTLEWGRPEILKAIQNNSGSGVDTYTVKCETSVNGITSATPKAGLIPGDTVTVTVTPSSGYELDTLLVGGTNVVAQVKGNQYTFSMPAHNVTVSATFKQVTSGHVHSYTETHTPPTCTEKGYTTYTCTCGDSYVGNEVEAKGHSDVTVTGKEATCTESGLTEGKKCSVCGETLIAQEVIPVKGHDYQGGKCTMCGANDPYCVEASVNVKRVAGGSRYSTCTKVADELKATLGGKPFDAVIVASGADFPDALAGTYLAAVKKAPILLIDDGHIEMMVKYIKENMAGDGIIYILGSEKAVSKKAADELAAVGNVKRLGGKSRFITNLRILEEMNAKTGELLVVYSVAPWDALSVSSSGCPILLVNDKLRDDQREYLETTSFDRITVIGSNKVISDDLMKELSAYCGDVGRVYGSSRYKTTIEVAKYFYGTKNGSVVLACGNNFPDGLCSGALAYAKKAPVILTDIGRESLAAGYVTDYNIQIGYVIGSAKVVSDDSVRKAFNMTETDIIK